MEYDRRHAAFAQSVNHATVMWGLQQHVRTDDAKLAAVSRIWMGLVYVALETWHELRTRYPSSTLAEYWDDPRRPLLQGLRNKTFHYGSDFGPKEQLRFLEADDAVEWTHDLMHALIEHVVDGWTLAPSLEDILDGNHREH